MLDTPTPITLLYIGGAGRSGSTLMEMVLGSLPGFFSVGEVYRFWNWMHRSDTFCGCRLPLHECPFWVEVRKDIALTDADITLLDQQTRRLNRTRRALLIAGGAANQHPDWVHLRHRTAQLYRAIAHHSQARVIVDSSKTPSHLHLLRQIPELDIRVLHLVRDSRAVAHSWSARHGTYQIGSISGRIGQRGVLASALAWLFENVMIMRLQGKLPYVRLRYEDFTAAPIRALQTSLDALNIPSSDLRFLDAEHFSPPMIHGIGGNRMRYQTDSMRISPDEKWRQAFPHLPRLFVSTLTAPLLLRYGYTL